MTLALGAVAFAAGYACSSAGLWALLLALSGGPVGATRREWIDDAAVAGYLTILMAALNAVAFTLVAAASRAWRRQGKGRAAGRGALLGATAALMSVTGIWVLPAIALGRAMGAAFAVGVGFVSPGLLAGLLGVFWARLRDRGMPKPEPAGPGQAT